MGSGLPGSPPSYLLFHLLLYMSYLANKIVVVVDQYEEDQRGQIIDQLVSDVMYLKPFP